jgi:hypothetical protein
MSTEAGGGAVNAIINFCGRVLGLVGVGGYMFLAFGALPGWVYWIWMAIQFKSFAMFLVAFLGPFAVVAAFVGLWSLLLGVPHWLLSVVT